MNLTTLSAVGSDFFTGNTRFRQRINSSLNSSSLSVWRHVVCNVRSEFTSFLCVAAVFCASEKIVWMVLEGLLLTTTPGIVFSLAFSPDVLVILFVDALDNQLGSEFILASGRCRSSGRDLPDFVGLYRDAPKYNHPHPRLLVNVTDSIDLQ